MDASLESINKRQTIDQIGSKKTEKKSKDDAEIIAKEPQFTFASNFNMADRSSLRDSGPLSIDREHIKYENTISELKVRISELQG